MRKRNWLFPAALSGIVLAGAWVHLLLEGAAPDAPLDPTRPDYVVNDLRITEMSADGTPDRVLEAATLRHYSKADLTEADAPLVHLYRDGSPEWHVRGESGRLVRNRTEILLDGKVWIDRESAAGGEPVHITTRDLRIIHGERYAETAEATVIEDSKHRIEGIGLEAWFDSPVRIKLLNEVRGRHEI